MSDPQHGDAKPAKRIEEGRPAGEGGVAVMDTASLFAGGSEVRLIHRGQEYRLRITRQGKLILTK